MTTTPALSVIVVNWNAGELLTACLASVEAATAGLQAEVWVVDNASSDGSADRALRAHPQAYLLRNSENVGFARAANHALAQAKGEFLLLLNPDAELSSEALDQMLATMSSHPRVGIVGCGSVDEEGRASPGHELSYPGQRRTLPQRGRRAGGALEVAWVSGACLLARQAMVQEIGPLDEGFFMYYEDVDWCCRARKAGWKVMAVTSAHIWHRLGATAAQVPAAETACRAAASRLRFYRKHYPPARAGWLCLRMLVANLAGWAWRLPPSLVSQRARERRQVHAARLQGVLGKPRV
jgi:hypothetical protein